MAIVLSQLFVDISRDERHVQRVQSSTHLANLPLCLAVVAVFQITFLNKKRRRAAATICPRPGLHRKRVAAALSQAGRAGPDQPIRAIQPAGRTRRPPTGCTRQTSDRQTSDNIIA